MAIILLELEVFIYITSSLTGKGGALGLQPYVKIRKAPKPNPRPGKVSCSAKVVLHTMMQ